MESDECNLILESNKKMFQIFSDFMTRITQFEELVAVGSRLLDGFHQGLKFLQRPPIGGTSDLVNYIVRANETKRLSKYVEVGCKNSYDNMQNTSKLHTCQVGLLDHLSKAKKIVDELEGLVKEATNVMETLNSSRLNFLGEIIGHDFGPGATVCDKEEIASPGLQEPEITDYAAMMSIIYVMIQQDCIMQERIIASLNLKSSSGELETYSLMWSLRPFVEDATMHQAWKLIP